MAMTKNCLLVVFLLAMIMFGLTSSIDFSKTQNTNLVSGLISPDSINAQVSNTTSTMNVSLAWERYYGDLGVRNGDTAKIVIQTSDGGFMLAGTAFNRYGYSPFRMALAKTDSSGTLEWSEHYPINGITGLAQADDGGYVVAGGFMRPYYDDPSRFADTTIPIILKLDSNGTQQWNKTYTYEGFGAITKTYDGGFALAGAEKSKVWLIKIDSSGNVQWNQTFGQDVRWVFRIIETSDCGFVIATSSESSYNDSHLFKTNSAGELVWSKDITGRINSVIQTGDGGYVFSGSIEEVGDCRFGKMNSSGDILWKHYTTSSVSSVIETSDEGLAFIGYKSELAGLSSLVWMGKTDSAGVFEWDIMFGGQKFREYGYVGSCIIETSDGSLAVSGVWTQTGSVVHYYLAKTEPILPPPTPNPSHSPPTTPTPTNSLTPLSTLTQLTPTTTIPEFPSWIILPLTLVVGLVVSIIVRRKCFVKG